PHRSPVRTACWSSLPTPLLGAPARSLPRSIPSASPRRASPSSRFSYLGFCEAAVPAGLAARGPVRLGAAARRTSPLPLDAAERYSREEFVILLDDYELPVFVERPRSIQGNPRQRGFVVPSRAVAALRPCVRRRRQWCSSESCKLEKPSRQPGF